MLRFALVALAVVFLSGCVSAEEQRARDLASDQQRCNAYGLQPGSSAYVLCMAMVAQQREDQRRTAAAIANLNTQINQLNQRQQRQDPQDFMNFSKSNAHSSTNTSGTSSTSSTSSMVPSITAPTIPSINTSGINTSDMHCATVSKSNGNASSVPQSCHN